MREVSRFENDLLRLLHAILGQTPIDRVISVVAEEHERPDCLSPDAIALVQDALAKGCVARLAREGGWRHERHLREERVVAGRLWERTSPEELGLRFTGETLELLLGLVCFNPFEHSLGGSTPGALTVGDQFFSFLVYESLRPTRFGEVLAQQAVFRVNGLCRLAFPEDFSPKKRASLPEFACWTEGAGVFIVESLQSRLAERWKTIEEQKRQIDSAERLLAVSRSQALVLDGFLNAVERAGRRDLARFLLMAATAVLREQGLGSPAVNPAVLRGLQLSKRTEFQRTAMVFNSVLERLRSWEREARAIGYFDDGYAAAQLWKADWEALGGESLCERAESLRREFDPLRQTVEEPT